MYIIKVNKDYDYIPILMAKGFCSQIDGVLHIDRHVPLSEDDPERIAPTITHTFDLQICTRYSKTLCHHSSLLIRFLWCVKTKFYIFCNKSLTLLMYLDLLLFHYK